jgi:hypothetical protein
MIDHTNIEYAIRAIMLATMTKKMEFDMRACNFLTGYGVQKTKIVQTGN